MKTQSRLGASVAVLLVLAIGMGADDAAMKVTLSDVHLCCGACVKAVEKAVAKVEGVKAEVSQDDATAVLTGPSKAKVQEAIDEIAKAGFSGKPDNDQVKFKPVKTADGKVTKLEITHVHNCCPGCSDVLKEAVEGIDGVKSNTIEPKKSSFVVEGDFVAADVVKAIQDAGFYAQVK
jgi:copper chaperone CopZ